MICTTCGTWAREASDTCEDHHPNCYFRDPMLYSFGDRVRKIGGDYTLIGTVVAAFRKASGAVRYVVEADEPRGLLHIYSNANLEPLP